MKTIIINCLNKPFPEDILAKFNSDECSFISLEVLNPDLFELLNNNIPIQTIDQVNIINTLMNIKQSFPKDTKIVFFNLLEKFIPKIKELSYIKIEYSQAGIDYLGYKIEATKTFLK